MAMQVPKPKLPVDPKNPTPDEVARAKKDIQSYKTAMAVFKVGSDEYKQYVDIIQSLKYVDEVMTFNDSDGTVCQLLKIAKICYPNADITYISQEDMHNMPETKIRGITFETMK